jgi:hypothetical protein
MRLIFIASADGYNGENGDLFVIAETIGEAKRLWREHYELEDDAEPDRMFELPVAFRHFEDKARVMPWHSEVVEL